MFPGYWTGIKEDMKDTNRITLADMIMDIFSEYVQEYIRIYKDILGYVRISQLDIFSGIWIPILS